MIVFEDEDYIWDCDKINQLRTAIQTFEDRIQLIEQTVKQENYENVSDPKLLEICDQYVVENDKLYSATHENDWISDCAMRLDDSRYTTLEYYDLELEPEDISDQFRNEFTCKLISICQHSKTNPEK